MRRTKDRGLAWVWRRWPATLGLTLILVGSYAVQLIVPAYTGLMASWTPALAQAPWKLVSSGLVHSTSTFPSSHLLGNLLALWYVGLLLEKIVGSWRFIAVFTVGVLGGVAAVALLSDPRVVSVGASGGIFALATSLLVVVRGQASAFRGLAVVVIIMFVQGVLTPGVSWQAHLGGAVVGVVLGAGARFHPGVVQRARCSFHEGKPNVIDLREKGTAKESAAEVDPAEANPARGTGGATVGGAAASARARTVGEWAVYAAVVITSVVLALQAASRASSGWMAP